MKLVRTGEKIPFLDINIGSPFYAHKRYWVRSAFDAASELKDSDFRGGNCCNFLIDGNTAPLRGPYGKEGELCEEVEVIRCEL